MKSYFPYSTQNVFEIDHKHNDILDTMLSNELNIVTGTFDWKQNTICVYLVKGSYSFTVI